MQMAFVVYIVIIAVVLVYYGIIMLLDRRANRRYQRSTKGEYHHNPRKDFFVFPTQVGVFLDMTLMYQVHLPISHVSGGVSMP